MIKACSWAGVLSQRDLSGASHFLQQKTTIQRFELPKDHQSQLWVLLSLL